MYSLTLENKKGRTLELTNNESKWQIVNIDGLNPADAEIETEQLANWDGEVFVSSRIESRNISIELYINGDAEINRIELYKFLKTKEFIKLIFTTNTRKVFIESYIEKIDINLFDEHQVMQIDLICPTPFFVDFEEQETELKETLGGFYFPFSIDKIGIEFSTIKKNRVVSVVNYGEIATGMTIEISFLGDVKTPTIWNTENEQFIKINSSFTKGEIIKICTIKGKRSIKKIVANVETNIIDLFDINSTWLQLESGNNFFTLRAEEKAENAIIKFYNNIYYQGL